MWLRQRDGVTCGPSVAVMAGALLDDEYGAPLKAEEAQQWFAAEQGRSPGDQPGAAASAGHHPGRDGARADRARTALPLAHGHSEGRPGRRVRGRQRGFPVAMLIGNALPRHWVLLTEVDGLTVRCYEPGRGQLVDVTVREDQGSPAGNDWGSMGGTRSSCCRASFPAVDRRHTSVQQRQVEGVLESCLAATASRTVLPRRAARAVDWHHDATHHGSATNLPNADKPASRRRFRTSDR